MSADYESLRLELHIIAPWVIPLISITNSAGGGQTLIDTLMWQATANDYLTAETATGMWVLRPDAADPTDRERRLSGITIASGTLTQDGKAYVNSPGAAEQYEIHAIRPKDTFNLLLSTMDEFLQPTYQSLSRTADADMEATGTTNYSISGAGSITKVTTAANVHSGAQSLFLDAGTAGEYVEGPTIKVVPSRGYFASVILRADVGTGSFAVWDKTNNVEIAGRVSSSLERFMSLQRTFTTPATCEEISLRVYVTGASDDVYIDSFHGPYKPSDPLINAPSWLTRESNLRKMSEARYLDQYATGIYDADSRVYDEWQPRLYHVRVNTSHANPYRIELRASLPMQEMWIEGIRKASGITTFAFTAAGETAPTTEIDKHTLALLWARNISRHVLSYRRDDEDAKATLGQCDEELEPLLKDYYGDLETPSYMHPHPLTGSVRA